MTNKVLILKEDIGQIKPLNTYCVVERLDQPDEEKKTPAGLIISPTAKTYNNERLLQARILEIGTKCTEGVKVGDIVLYDKHASIAVDKSLRRLVREEDIYAIITDC